MHQFLQAATTGAHMTGNELHHTFGLSSSPLFALYLVCKLRLEVSEARSPVTRRHPLPLRWLIGIVSGHDDNACGFTNHDVQLHGKG